MVRLFMWLEARTLKTWLRPFLGSESKLFKRFFDVIAVMNEME